MPSLQSSAPGSKSSKFTALDPLAPFTAQPGDEPEVVEEIITERTDGRLRNIGQLVNPYQYQHPGGAAPSTMMPQQQQEQHQQAPLHMQSPDTANNNSSNSKKAESKEDDDNSFNDSDFDDDLDDDGAMEAFRQRRLQQLKQQQIKRVENIAKGHQDYRTITQDEFLPECTGSSEFVAVHFFHKDFERCKIMDMHLRKIVQKHTTCKFLRLDAEKAPFFASKLQLKTLPTLIVFQDGTTVDRLMGFQGLASSTLRPDEFKTRKLEQWLHGTGAIQYKPSDDDEDDDSDSDDGGERGRYGRLGTFGRAQERSRRYDEDV
mmetsp:Transcript_10669/g.29428  ORF Transcript_10669/g.29428 Transcript_10669/m.29428 type:complete len:318 (-) Transcript_10669:217-1170(-)